MAYGLGGFVRGLFAGGLFAGYRLKVTKLSHLLMFTGTELNTLVPEYVIDCIV